MTTETKIIYNFRRYKVTADEVRYYLPAGKVGKRWVSGKWKLVSPEEAAKVRAHIDGLGGVPA